MANRARICLRLSKSDAEGNPGKGDETKPENYYAFGQDVSAAAGTVYEVRDGIDDKPMAQFADADSSIVMKRLNESQTKLRQQDECAERKEITSL